MANDPLNERDWVERAASMPRYLSTRLKRGVRMPVVVYRSRRTIALVLYSIIAVFAYATAFLLRFEFKLSDNELLILASTLPLLIGIRALCYYAFGVTRARWRFAGSHDLLRLSAATVTGSFVFYLMSRSIPLIPNMPRSVVAIEWGLTTYGIASWWILYRTVVEKLRFFRTDEGGRRALIVGAGEAGSMLAREMNRFPTGYRPVAFVDDDPAKIGTTIHGLHVLACTDRLAETASVMQAEEIVIAVPSASPENLRRIVEKCEANDLRFKVLPGIAEVIAGQAIPMHVRELRIEDLLGREPITLELPELREDLASRSVLITGAAGSIGSELARQVALHRPGLLVLFDQAETGLFHLELEMRERFPDLQMVFLIGDVVDEVAVEKTFRAYTPSRVFHAAAYKHVPMMQTNLRQALRNNVLGTWRVSDAAGRYGSDKFVLVSTDKAVEPTSVMGATKRLAEIAALEMQHRYPDTNYAAVRFGNVLGSAGSVIPIFQDQIARNKPLTITHPEVTRYFMTISEAVQLILQTSVRPEVSGQIAMLEMGEAIRIVDLARNLLRLSGVPYRVGHTVVFTGLRPGEKLHEELFAFDETTSATLIPKVRVVRPAKVTMSHVESLIDAWEEAFMEQRDPDVAAQLSGIFPSLHGRAPSPRVVEGLAVR